MSYLVKGKIVSISDVQKFDSGSGKRTFRIDTGEQYNNLLEFELFKGKDYLEHLDKFTKYNKVGDYVEVEFKLKSNHYTKNGKDVVFTSLSCWRCNSMDGAAIPDTLNEENTAIPADQVDDLPF